MKRIVLLFLCCIAVFTNPVKAQELWPEQRGNLWGYVADDSTIVIPFIYEMARNFENGLAWVKMHDKWGLIDTKGKQVFAFEFDEAEDFYKGNAVVIKGSRYGLITAEGKMLVPCRYDDLFYPYTQKKKYIASVYMGETEGLVRSDGKIEWPDGKEPLPSNAVDLDFLKLIIFLPDGWRADGFGGMIGGWEEGGSAVCDCAGVIVDNVPHGDVKMVVYPYLPKNIQNPKRLKVWDYSWQEDKSFSPQQVKAKYLSFSMKKGYWLNEGESTKMEVWQYEASAGKVGYRVYIWNDNIKKPGSDVYSQFVQTLLDALKPAG